MEDLRSSRACCGLVPTAPTEDALRTIFVLSGMSSNVAIMSLPGRLFGTRAASYGIIPIPRGTARVWPRRVS